jgi:diguanylate cyclase (GGDEF)-like protein/PAS domain S-box-containing protein
MRLERFPVMQVIATREPLRGMLMISRPPEGPDVWAEVNAEPLLDDSGELIEVAVTFIDVTERERQQRAATSASATLRASAEYSRSLIEASLDPLFTISQEGRITDVNAATTTITGRTRGELIGTDFSAYFTSPQDARAGFERVFRDGQVVDLPLEIRHVSGHVTPVLYNASVYRDANGEVVGVFAAARDVTEVTAVANALRQSEQTFRLAMDGAPQGMAVVGLDLELLRVNPVLCSMLHRDEAWLVSHSLRDVLPDDDLDAYLAARRELLNGSTRMETFESSWHNGEGVVLWVVHSIALLRDDDGTPLYLVTHIQDNTDAHRVREELLHRANHDPLTGLINRDQLRAHITHLLTFPSPSGGTLGVLFCDLDRFKDINDRHGHSVGDEVLRVSAHRIASTLRLADVAARLGGDEFVVVLDRVPSQQTAIAVAEKIRRAVAQPVPIGDGTTVTVTASIGVALATPGADAHRLLRNADAALYEAKNAGRDQIAIFHNGTPTQGAVDIRNGLRDGHFVPWYQPIVSLRDGALVGYEALARWVRPGGDVVAPNGFLSDAQRSNLITDLDWTILEQSLEALSAMPAPLHLAVNVSAASLTTGGFEERVSEALALSGADPSRLHLEFTETALLGVTTDVRATMTGLADVGVRWFVDDFGTGYSSLSHLRDLPIAGLKLDLSFTAGLDSGDPTCTHLAHALAGLAEGLGLDTVAEGVETRRQVEVLSSQGWKHGQGWLYGRPTPDRSLSR